MSDLWSVRVRNRSAISGWRDPNRLIREHVFERIRMWTLRWKLLPEKLVGKSLPKLAANQDVLIATWKAKGKAKLKLPAPPLVWPYSVETWLRDAIFAELGWSDTAPMELVSLELEIGQSHPDAAPPSSGAESRFLWRMLTARSETLQARWPEWLEAEFDPDAGGSKLPNAFLLYEFAKRTKSDTRFAVEAVIEAAVASEIPDTFDSTAY